MSHNRKRDATTDDSVPAKAQRLEETETSVVAGQDESQSDGTSPEAQRLEETDTSVVAGQDESQSDGTSPEWVLLEAKGDLFKAPKEFSLAHCVSADLHMGKGIAATFKSKFGGKVELMKQKKKVGDVAIQGGPEEGQFIYYLITKEKFGDLPPADCSTLRQSLQAMRRHCLEHRVTQVAMPRIGTGLDKLDFDKVKAVLRDVFGETNISITIYSL